MKTKWNYSNYNNDLRLTTNDAKNCSHSGDCLSDVLEVLKKPYVINQLANFDANNLAKELKEYGAWDDNDLKNHNENLKRWVWISASDIIERN